MNRRIVNLYLTILLTVILNFPSIAQTINEIQPILTDAQISKAYQLAVTKHKSMTKEQINALIARSKHRNPKHNQILSTWMSSEVINNQSKNIETSLQSSLKLSMPTKFTIPGEFEESQAAMVIWSSRAFDADGNDISSFTKDYGYIYDEISNSLIVKRIAGFLIDTLSDYAAVTATLANAIQQEVPVWIVVYSSSDTNTVKQYMLHRGTPLQQYRFFITGGGNEWWARDFGPIGFYYGDQDSVGFLDVQYYGFRPADDAIPQIIGNELQYKTWTTTLENEGGNFMTDGWGNSFSSTAVFSSNSDNEGMGRIVTTNGKTSIDVAPKAIWSQTRTRDTMQNVYGAKRITILPRLQCDGGTGHIDMYLKLFDDETLIASEYGEPFNNPDFNDYKISNTAVNNIKSLLSTHNRSMRVLRMPIPTMDNGRYDSTTCESFDYDPRGFLNGLTINKTFLFPSFSNELSGNKKQTQEAIELYRKYLPGYKIVPIDSRLLTPMGGAVHCITMQIPAENPLRIRHAAWRDNVATQTNYPIAATITNKSGIKSATMSWRVKGTSEWKTSPLTEGASSTFTGDIPGNLNATNESIEYFIAAEANNGKKQVYPITAPDGFFTFTYGKTVSVAEENFARAEMQMPYPNPAASTVFVPFTIMENAQVQATVFDITGSLVTSFPAESLAFGSYVRSIDLTDLASGVYQLRLTVNGITIGSSMISKF